MSDYGYHEDSEEHFDQPHVHRCVGCGGFILLMGIDAHTCDYCEGMRPRCTQCLKGASP